MYVIQLSNRTFIRWDGPYVHNIVVQSDGPNVRNIVVRSDGSVLSDRMVQKTVVRLLSLPRRVVLVPSYHYTIFLFLSFYHFNFYHFFRRSYSDECMTSYRRQAMRGWGCWRQGSRRSGRGRSRRRSTVADEVLVVSNQNRGVPHTSSSITSDGSLCYESLTTSCKKFEKYHRQKL